MELIELELYNPRDFAEDNYGRVDDYSYGGGPGMVMKFATLEKAVMKARSRRARRSESVVDEPQGATLDHQLINRLSAEHCQSFILVCGRYEGVDEEFIEKCVDLEISIGDYVVSGEGPPCYGFY